MKKRISILFGMFALIIVILANPAYAVNLESAVAIWLFDEEDDEVIVDSSGNGNDGTLMNGTKWVNDGKFGGALQFDGMDDHVEVPASESLEMGESDLTLSFWFKTSSSEFQRPLTKGAVDTAREGYASFMRDDVLCAQLSDGKARQHIPGKIKVTDGAWHFGTIVWERNATTRIYVDGQLDVEQATSYQGEEITKETVPVIMGKKSIDSAQYFDGLLDEIAIFKEALTEDEIESVMQGLASLIIAVEPSGKLTTTWASIKAQR